MDAAAAHLLDFSKPFDSSLLDQIVAIAMDGLHPQRPAANEFLVRMKEHPDMWKRADAILETSKQLTTKFFGLQVLSDAINTRWKIIPSDQREGIRNYIVSKIIALSTTDELLRQNNTFLLRLNLVLVGILKQDWPHNWPTFISDLVGSSKTSESLCENNMKILKLLSEEVFDYSKDTMTAAKIKTMKESLTDEFSQVFQLCEFILDASQRPSLLQATLQTLQRFLTWIPLGYIFETQLVSTLVTKYFPIAAFRYAIA
jgi:exportin-1